MEQPSKLRRKKSLDSKADSKANSQDFTLPFRRRRDILDHPGPAMASKWTSSAATINHPALRPNRDESMVVDDDGDAFKVINKDPTGDLEKARLRQEQEAKEASFNKTMQEEFEKLHRKAEREFKKQHLEKDIRDPNGKDNTNPFGPFNSLSHHEVSRFCSRRARDAYERMMRLPNYSDESIAESERRRE